VVQRYRLRRSAGVQGNSGAAVQGYGVGMGGGGGVKLE
jgi:hypothetical protein